MCVLQALCAGKDCKAHKLRSCDDANVGTADSYFRSGYYGVLFFDQLGYHLSAGLTIAKGNDV